MKFRKHLEPENFSLNGEGDVEEWGNRVRLNPPLSPSAPHLALSPLPSSPPLSLLFQPIVSKEPPPPPLYAVQTLAQPQAKSKPFLKSKCRLIFTAGEKKIKKLINYCSIEISTFKDKYFFDYAFLRKHLLRQAPVYETEGLQTMRTNLLLRMTMRMAGHVI